MAHIRGYNLDLNTEDNDTIYVPAFDGQVRSKGDIKLKTHEIAHCLEQGDKPIVTIFVPKRRPKK